MNQTLGELIKSLQAIEDQDQRVVSLIVLAQDVIKYDEETKQDEEVTTEEFAKAIDEAYKPIVHSIDEAFEYITGEIIQALEA